MCRLSSESSDSFALGLSCSFDFSGPRCRAVPHMRDDDADDDDDGDDKHTISFAFVCGYSGKKRSTMLTFVIFDFSPILSSLKSRMCAVRARLCVCITANRSVKIQTEV